MEDKKKRETMNKGNEQETVTNMVNTNPTTSIVTLNVNGLTTPVKKAREDQNGLKKKRPKYMLFTRNPF